MSRFFLADPSLVSYSGHCFEYLHALIGPLRQPPSGRRSGDSFTTPTA